LYNHPSKEAIRIAKRDGLLLLKLIIYALFVVFSWFHLLAGTEAIEFFLIFMFSTHMVVKKLIDPTIERLTKPGDFPSRGK